MFAKQFLSSSVLPTIWKVPTTSLSSSWNFANNLKRTYLTWRPGVLVTSTTVYDEQHQFDEPMKEHIIDILEDEYFHVFVWDDVQGQIPIHIHINE